MMYMMRDTSIFPADQDSSQFPATLPPYIAAVVFETFLYGLYFILFFIAVFVLRHSPIRMPRLHSVLIISAVLMFSLATADMVYTLILLFGRVFGDGSLKFRNLYPKYAMYVTNNVIADSLLLYRCYMIWGRNNYVLIGPLMLLIAATVCGYIFEGATPELSRHSWIYLSMTFAFNVGVTTLAAGRIWWIGYKARRILGEEIARQYNSTIAILVESGIVYSIYVTLDLAFQYYPSVNVILDTGLIQVVGIMPTLLIVQVGLGRATQDMDATISAMRFAAGVKTNNADANPGSGGQGGEQEVSVSEPGTRRGKVFSPEVNLNSSSESLERQSALQERLSARALGLRTGMIPSSGSGIGGSTTALYSPTTNDTSATPETRTLGLRPSQTVPLTPKSSKSFTRSLSRGQSATRSATPANLTPKSSTPSLWSKVTIYRRGRGDSGDTEESEALVPMKESVIEEDLEQGVVEDPSWLGGPRGDKKLGGNGDAG